MKKFFLKQTFTNDKEINLCKTWGNSIKPLWFRKHSLYNSTATYYKLPAMHMDEPT